MAPVGLPGGYFGAGCPVRWPSLLPLRCPDRAPPLQQRSTSTLCWTNTRNEGHTRDALLGQHDLTERASSLRSLVRTQQVGTSSYCSSYNRTFPNTRQPSSRGTAAPGPAGMQGRCSHSNITGQVDWSWAKTHRVMYVSTPYDVTTSSYSIEHKAPPDKLIVSSVFTSSSLLTGNSVLATAQPRHHWNGARRCAQVLCSCLC